ncbi:MAG: response regulator [Acidobacteriota bacterium]|jgi:two-component system phosphate regulon sensor histidine kinase PhoR|nr:response regulator [Acidobacteriota bacterium]
MAASILVVDDEPGIRTGVREILALEGYDVEAADCGRAALDLIDGGNAYDVFLIDYRLPDIDGLTLLQSIQRKAPDAMTCMITAYANIETAVFATRQGVDVFLPKPFTPDDLVGTVENLLGYKKLRDEASALRAAHEASLLELASEKSQTHSLVSSLRDGVLVANRQGEIALANRAMEELLGAEADSLLGRQASVALADGVLAPALASLAPDNPAPGVFEVEVDAASGRQAGDAEPRRLFIKVNGFYDDKGARLGSILTAVDISAVRRMAMEKARFTRTLVHELRAPLGALKSIIEVMQDRSLGDSLEPYAKSLARANERIDGLGELISDLLSLSSIEHKGTDQTPAAPLDVAPAIRETVDLWKDRAAAVPVALEVDLQEGLPPCAIADDDLRTILTNLVGNAVKYNRAGGKVAVSARRTPEGIALAVRDTGIGIAAENVARLGEEFFREKKPETKRIEGNGLGLAIVKRLVGHAGGRLEISSRAGEGSEFRVILPC